MDEFAYSSLVWRIVRRVVKRPNRMKPEHSSANYKNLIGRDIFYLSDFFEVTNYIKGMTSAESCSNLFILAFSQSLKGDIIEIGSWQGKSTSFLAKAAQLSNNGKVFAIDHFKGNPGKKMFYKIGKDDLSDLSLSFKNNISSLDLDDTVEQLEMSSENAATKLRDRKIKARILFIDGCHDYDAVKDDYCNFSNLVIPGGLIIFDDYSKSFPGVVKFVEELLEERGNDFSSFSYSNTFVLRQC